MNRRAKQARVAAEPRDYTRLGLQKGTVEPWEDGLRTSGGRNTYEWWYFDAHLDDGSKLVIVFFTKEIAEVGNPLRPCIRFTLDRLDGSHVERVTYFRPDVFEASKDGCDVRIGSNTFAGDLHTYRIHLELDGVEADVTLTGTVPAWRPETGHLVFGDQDEYLFAWLPAVPRGEVQAALRIDGQSQECHGNGYHDHNWGNISLLKLVHHWYWARGTVGDYTVIASHITAERRYGFQSFPVFMLAYRGDIIADDATMVRFSAAEEHLDLETGRPVADLTIYDYDGGDRHLRITFRRRTTILRLKLIETIHGIQALLARLIGFDGVFLRFIGDLTLEWLDGERVVESDHDEAIWEMMYFGRVPRHIK